MPIRYPKLPATILLCLLLVIGLGLSEAHSHEGHEESDCAFAIVQNAEAGLDVNNQLRPLQINRRAHPQRLISKLFTHKATGFSARAPPFSL